MEAIKTLKDLSYNLSLGPGYDGFAALVEAVELAPEELEGICQWNDDHYQRIRIYDTKSLEALITCWQPGQSGPIHNYEFQQGWMKVIQGELKLEYFQNLDDEPKAYNISVLKAGEMIYLNDNLGYHRFSNQGQSRAIGLHFYSDRIKKWHVYDENTGQVAEKMVDCDKVVEV